MSGIVYSDQSKNYIKESIRLSNYNLVAIGYQKLVTNNSAQALTIPDNARYAIIKTESNVTTSAIRYLELGDILLPTTTDGIALSNNDVISIEGYQNLINFRVIRTGISVTSLHIQYYK